MEYKKMNGTDLNDECLGSLKKEREVLDCFISTFLEYGGQPSVYLLITYDLNDPTYTVIIRVALTKSEAKDWLDNTFFEGQGKKVERILLYKHKEYEHIQRFYKP